MALSKGSSLRRSAWLAPLSGGGRAAQGWEGGAKAGPKAGDQVTFRVATRPQTAAAAQKLGGAVARLAGARAHSPSHGHPLRLSGLRAMLEGSPAHAHRFARKKGTHAIAMGGVTR